MRVSKIIKCKGDEKKRERKREGERETERLNHNVMISAFDEKWDKYANDNAEWGIRHHDDNNIKMKQIWLIFQN